MSLNKSIVDLYKQRGEQINSKRKSSRAGRNQSKRPDENNHKLLASQHNNQPDIFPPSSPNGAPAKRPKVEDNFVADSEKRSHVTLDQLHGLQSACADVRKIIDYFKTCLANQQKASYNIEYATLVYGSHGLGKTSLIEAAANYGNLKLIRISLDSMIKSFRTKFETDLEILMRHALANQPCILLIDDLNNLDTKQEYTPIVKDIIRKALDESQSLLIFCSTSSMLDRREYEQFILKTIRLKRPCQEARHQILKTLRSKYEPRDSELSDQQLEILASKTPSFTAVDLKKMLLNALVESGGKLNVHHCNEAIEILKQDFEPGTLLVGEKPLVTWNDIGGLSGVKKKFENILRSVKDPRQNEDEDGRFSGIVLYGPPGCGKTMIAKAMANQAEMNFISIKPGELFDKYLGETEKNIRRVFEEAREYEPCMIYFDEFEALCGTRGVKETGARAIETLLAEMDGFGRRESFVMAATNRLDDIDPAMRRPGRLSKSIYVGPPDREARLDILKVITSRNKSGWQLDESVRLGKLADETGGFTGADLKFLVVTAKSKAVDELETNFSKLCSVNNSFVVTEEHFSDALKEIHDRNKEVKVMSTIKKR